MSDGVTGNQHSRRRFLDILLGVAAGGALGSVFYPVLRYLTPLRTEGPSGPTRLGRDAVATLAQKHFIIVPVAGQRVLVFLGSDQKLRALAARCTHEGCTVQYVPAESLIWCACHNGRFDLEGRVVSGPPPRPLPRYVAERDEDGTILIRESA